jgi:hypothetical protein
MVEAQVSFIVIPIKGGRRKMLTMLRSLALIKANLIKVRAKLTRLSIKLTRSKGDRNTDRDRTNSEDESDIDKAKGRIRPSTAEWTEEETKRFHGRRCRRPRRIERL